MAGGKGGRGHDSFVAGLEVWGSGETYLRYKGTRETRNGGKRVRQCVDGATFWSHIVVTMPALQPKEPGGRGGGGEKFTN